MLVRTDPFRDLDRLAQQAFAPTTRPAAMPMDAFRLDGTFVIELDLPGVEKDSIDVTVEKNVLTVHARRSRGALDGVEYLVGERRHGSFSRQLILGDSLDVDAIEATYDDGVLTVRIPVSERAKPRKIEIGGAAAGPAAIDTGSHEHEHELASTS